MKHVGECRWVGREWYSMTALGKGSPTRSAFLRVELVKDGSGSGERRAKEPRE